MFEQKQSMRAALCFSTEDTAAQTSDMSQTQMKMMAYFMPLFIGFISWSFASGLVLYWVAMNCCQIVQQWWMYRGKEKPGKAKAAKKEEA